MVGRNTQYFVEKCANELTPILWRLFWLYCETGVFLVNMKSADVYPLCKHDINNLVEIYGAISLVSNISKLINEELIS